MEEGIWVEVSAEYQAPDGMSFRKGQAAVIALARKNAIEKATGFTITSFSLLRTNEKDFKWSEDYQRLIVSESNGKIIDEVPPKVDIDSKRKGGIFFKIERYRAKVIPDLSKEDPNFSVSAKTDKGTYRVGDEVKLIMEASMDAHLTVFSIAPDGSAALYLPNRFQKDAFVFGNDVSYFPDQYTQKIFTMRAKKTEGFRLPTNELFLVVATKSNYIFDDRRKSFVYYTDMLAINRWLMKIPRNERAEAFATFRVRE